MSNVPTLVVFAPHPDDEVIACGGTILLKRAQGMRVLIVFSTDGSRSHQAVLDIHEAPSPAELSVIRHGEAIAAAAALGVSEDCLTFVGATDTRLIDSIEMFRSSINAVLHAIDNLVEVYIPHEVRELNADHRITGAVVLEQLQQLDLTPRIYKYVVWDAQTEAEFGYVNRLAINASVDANEQRVEIDITAQLPGKIAALMQHQTQTSLYSKHQHRTVIPEGLMTRIRARSNEEFWLHRSN